MKHLMSWFGSGVAFAAGMILGIWLVRNGSAANRVAREYHVRQTKRLDRIYASSERQADALEAIAESMTQGRKKE